jgi:hypothetical protein
MQRRTARKGNLNSGFTMHDLDFLCDLATLREHILAV